MSNEYWYLSYLDKNNINYIILYEQNQSVNMWKLKLFNFISFNKRWIVAMTGIKHSTLLMNI